MADRGTVRRIVVLGNSGSGKTTLARRLACEHGIPCLDLDSIVWEPGQVAVRRPPFAVEADLDRFIERNESWVIEGCYATLAGRAAGRATEMIFLNPGVERCLENNRRRPFEPGKFASAEEQARNFESLQRWIAEYPVREDELGLAAHRRVFEAFRGLKEERSG